MTETGSSESSRTGYQVGLAKDKSLATIYIGDSKIEINCSEGGTIDEESLKNEINISLIKANRTKIDKCTVTGIADGYDVYGAAPETMPTAQSIRYCRRFRRME